MKFFNGYKRPKEAMPFGTRKMSFKLGGAEEKARQPATDKVLTAVCGCVLVVVVLCISPKARYESVVLGVLKVSLLCRYCSRLIALINNTHIH